MTIMQLASEVALLCAAGLHPNLVGLTGWYVDKSSALCLLLERCAGGTLSSLLRVRRGIYAVFKGIHWVRYAESNVADMHGHGASAAASRSSLSCPPCPPPPLAFRPLPPARDSQSRQGGAAEGAFPTDIVLSWFVQLLLALHHLHGRRILHR